MELCIVYQSKLVSKSTGITVMPSYTQLYSMIWCKSNISSPLTRDSVNKEEEHDRTSIAIIQMAFAVHAQAEYPRFEHRWIISRFQFERLAHETPSVSWTDILYRLYTAVAVHQCYSIYSYPCDILYQINNTMLSAGIENIVAWMAFPAVGWQGSPESIQSAENIG